MQAGSEWWKAKAKDMTKTIVLHEKSSRAYGEKNTPEITAQVLRAFENTPRHNFCMAGDRDYAYADRPLGIGSGQTISQPYIVALMTQLLDVKAGDRVLEIGGGSGYQAAILSTLGVEVFTIEIQKPLVKELEVKLAQFKNVHLKGGDGYHGWPENAPFDGIIITCAAEKEIPPKLVEQLKVGGYVVVPIEHESNHQVLYQTRKVDDKGKIQSKEIIGVRFVPFTREGDN
jgi:protein-L-isoaspartate(D-aspartate) O-methyltransferase